MHKDRPWSTVVRLPTTHGLVWFKALAPGTAYEVPLTVALARLVPDRVPQPLAGDVGRAWLLLADAGPTLRESHPYGGRPADWERLLREHAELQRRLAPATQELLELGVPDLRPHLLADRLAELLDDRAWLALIADGQPLGDVPRRLRAVLPALRERTDRLDACGIGATLQHDDLHDGNVAAGPDGDRVLDWGDACVSHPFVVLSVALRVATTQLALVEHDPQWQRLRDAYLEPWGADHDRSTLLAAARLALELAAVTRSHAWRRALATADPSDCQEFLPAIRAWLLAPLDLLGG